MIDYSVGAWVYSVIQVFCVILGNVFRGTE